jgi:hypothetical protein
MMDKLAGNMKRRASVAVNRMGMLSVGGRMVDLATMIKRQNEP